jgi:hypothetical protein
VNDSFWAIKPDGTKSWAFGYPLVRGSAAVAGDGSIYFAGIDAGVGVLYGFSPVGELKSYTSFIGEASGSPAIGKDGTIYVGAYRLQAYKGTNGLAKSCWPQFRGGPSQTGRAGAD